jgi:hypothetical protein
MFRVSLKFWRCLFLVSLKFWRCLYLPVSSSDDTYFFLVSSFDDVCTCLSEVLKMSVCCLSKVLKMSVTCLSQVLKVSPEPRHFWRYLFFASLDCWQCLFSCLSKLNSSQDILECNTWLYICLLQNLLMECHCLILNCDRPEGLIRKMLYLFYWLNVSIIYLYLQKLI